MAKKTYKPKAKKAAKKAQKIALNELKEINFDYIKSNHFRVIHVGGAHGGLGPKGNMIQMALFSERNAIPQRETYAIDEGKLGNLKESKGRDAIIREVEVEVLMDLNTATAIRNWLNDKIKQIEQLTSRVKAK
ncbi:MAG: hypothetical protein AMJ79_10680 [Phycisphaerae bacterium SM23_30]|nr:MAG: hypothetical protein AMJ79_10680 [Phycisphaerae bacterium SM23_30]